MSIKKSFAVGIDNKILVCITILMWLIIISPIYSYPKLSGALDTTVYSYSAEQKDFSKTETNYRIHESVMIDLDLTEKLGFYVNNRITYRTEEYEDPEQYDLNLYYGYLNYIITNNINIQFGRIMDINNLVYSYYDGCNLEYNFRLWKHRITLDLYGGLIVNDDYLEDEDKPYGYNSFDYRNLSIEQRCGDYIGGAKVNYLAKGIGIFSLDYQILYNDDDIAEEYASIDFDTMFSKRIKFYGYGTFDLIEESPSNTLVASRLYLFNYLSVIIEHEYYRPVYIKDSFFWSYFEPYGSQEVSGMLVFIISELLTIDVKYGKIFYDAPDNECGDEITGSIEHRDLFKFGAKLDMEYFSDPDGEKIRMQTMLTRRFYHIDAIGGGGVVFYNENELTDTFSKGYFATLGSDMRVLRSFILSLYGEYYNNPKYSYDIRGILSLKYLF